MKEENLKFEEYPLRVPTEKRTINKLETLVQELEECGSALTAKKAVNHWNKYMNDLGTDMGVIQTRYTLDTRNSVYRNAQQKLDELSPVFSNYSNKYEKILLKAKYRKDLEKIYGKYLFKMYENNQKAFDEKIIPELIEENKALKAQIDRILRAVKDKFGAELRA